MTIGERIDIALKKRGMTQRELAAAVGTTEVSMTRYISGKRTPKGSVIAKIAEVLEVSTDYLLMGDENAYKVPDWELRQRIWNMLACVDNEVMGLKFEIERRMPSKSDKLKGELRAYKKIQKELEELIDED